MVNLQDVAAETLAILDRGWYQAPDGQRVSIAAAQAAAVAGTRLYRPHELDELIAAGTHRRGRQAGAARRSRAALVVTGEKTQAAARRLVQEAGHDDLLVLNFASATRVGGGFLKGARAQEEDLARVSGLYRCLETQPEYYERNRAAASPLYTDHVIHSPAVPWFRDADLVLLAVPYLAALITAPAPNATRLLGRHAEPSRELRETLRRRAGHVLAVAAAHGHRNLLLGAWGCGVFGNDPGLVADAWVTHLRGRRFAGCFDHVEFAVYDTTREQRIVGAFRARVPGGR